MTTDEGYKILAESLLQTENTRGDYFINKAKDLGIQPIVFFTDLKLLYDGMVKHVNSKDYHVWGEDEQGKKEYLLKTINVWELTKGIFQGHINDNNVWQFAPGLDQFERIITGKATKETPKGFQSKLSDTQLERLYNQMQDNYFDATLANFKAIFKDEELPPDCAIKWTDIGQKRHEPNKQTIFEFLYLLKDFGHLDKSIFDVSPLDKNNLYRKLETLFPDIKNFSASNPHAVQNKTLRQKELKTIILTL